MKQNSAYPTILAALLCGCTLSTADVIGEWTFNSGETTADRLAISASETGVTISSLVINPAVEDFGPEAVPDSNRDGMGFGGTVNGNQVLFWHRANFFNSDGVGTTTWGAPGTDGVDTSVATAPMSFTVTADSGYDVTIDSISVDSENAGYLVFFQEAGASAGWESGGASASTTASLKFPVTIAAGTSKTFTLNWNSGALDDFFLVDAIRINGTVEADWTAPDKWAGYDIQNASGDVDTGNFIGWINIINGDWIWSYALARYIYLPEASVRSGGSWTFIPAYGAEASTYRHFNVIERNGRVHRTEPIPSATTPLWAEAVQQETYTWPEAEQDEPYFEGPIPFVRPPVEGSGEPFGSHHHVPAITWCDNGDLLAIWYTTKPAREGGEKSTDLTMLAARLRAGASEWDPSSEFFKAPQRNMHGDSLIRLSSGRLLHFNGMGKEGVEGWDELAMLLRESNDNGVTWTAARPVSTGASYAFRHMPIAGGIETSKGWLIQPVDAVPGAEGPSALHISRDGGATWQDAGGNIKGIHAGVVELSGDRLLAFGRAQAIDGFMPQSLSDDFGASWTYSATPFPPVKGGQRLVLLRLNEGPLLLVSFANGEPKMMFEDSSGSSFEGRGLFAALSFDEGQTWPVRKLITPGSGSYDGKGWLGIFEATPEQAEPLGYLAATQTPDGIIHLISSGLHYRFNRKWLETPNSR